MVTSDVNVGAVAGRSGVRRERLIATANDLRSWASEHRLLGGAGAVSEPLFAGPLTAARAFTGAAVDAMQQARLTGFSVNAATNTIFFLGNAKRTKTIRAALPENLQDGTKIDYAQARPLVIGDEPDETTFVADSNQGANGRYGCGSSVSPANTRMAGTLGCLVRVGDRLFGLSNNHVTGGCSQLPTGMPIGAPGVMDVVAGGTLPFAIGLHHSALPIVGGDPSVVDISENSDAALFSILDPVSVSSMQRRHFDTPDEVGDFDDGMTVEKVGRTTDLTRGTVHSFRVGATPVTYRLTVWTSPDSGVPFNTIVHFPEVWLVKSASGRFGCPGDSGSLVVATGPDGKRKAVGLLFAGNRDFTYVLELRPILKKLGATLVSRHNSV
jgi:hypothetical protein